MDLTEVSKKLTKSSTGVWVPAAAPSAQTLSYPEAGHSACFELEDGSFWFLHRNEVISTALGGHDFRGPFLDVGGGNGVVSRRLEKDGVETVLLEPGRDGAQNACARGLRAVVCATLEEAQFEPKSFGGAGLFDVIEHIEDDDALLRGVRNVLHRDGVLAITVPAYDWLWSAEDESAGHYRRYTRRRLRAALARANFDVVYETYFFAALTLPIFFARSLPSRLGRRPSPAVWEEAGSQHAPPKVARTAMNLLLAPELGRIRSGKAIPLGTSCLAIARAR